MTPLLDDFSPEPRIVVGVDGSEDSEEALRWAAAEARRRGATLCAVTAWQVPSIALIGAYVPGDLYENSKLAAQMTLDSALEAVAGELGGVRVVREVLEGAPTSVLGAVAEGADLLVLGTRGHGTISSIILGSVSKHMSTHAPCPVVVVRRPGHAPGGRPVRTQG